jgi:hypothetical protein
MPNVGDGSVLPVDPISVAKKAYQAYVEKDRAVIEAWSLTTFTLVTRSTIASTTSG